MLRNCILASLVLLLDVAPGICQLAEEGEVLDRGIESGIIAPTAERVVWRSPLIEEPGARYLRLEIVLERPPSDPTAEYLVHVVDADGGAVEVPRENLEKGETYWTPPVPNNVFVQVSADRAPAGLVLGIPRVARQRDAAQPLSQFGSDDREPIRELKDDPLLRTAAKAVAKLSFVEAGLLKSCTGFLVTENRFLTNEHCVASDSVCSTAVALFGFEESEHGVQVGTPFRCRRVIAVDRALDASLLELEGNPGLSQGTLQLAPRPVRKNDALIIVQHPAGRPKMVSRQNCFVTDPVADGNEGPDDFGHQCDTEGGSSGSPVMNTNHLVVGLHHLGFNQFGKWALKNRAVRAERFEGWLRPYLATFPAP